MHQRLHATRRFVLETSLFTLCVCVGGGGVKATLVTNDDPCLLVTCRMCHAAAAICLYRD
jgi:hypothetical protein